MYDELKELGLTDNEIKIFVILLRHGDMNPYEIAKKTGFHRGYVYDALERLQEKGIINTVIKNNKKCFQSIDPKHIEEMMQSRLESISKIIPDLMRIRQTKEDCVVELYKGEKSYKILIRDIIATAKKGDEILIYGVNDKLVMSIEPNYMKQYFAILKRKNISERVIIAEGQKQLSMAKTTKYRHLPEKYIGNAYYFVYANKLAIFLYSNPMHMILIGNMEISDIYRNQFDLLWNLAKK